MEVVEFTEVIEVMVIESHTTGRHTTMDINVMADINQLAWLPNFDLDTAYTHYFELAILSNLQF